MDNTSSSPDNLTTPTPSFNTKTPPPPLKKFNSTPSPIFKKIITAYLGIFVLMMGIIIGTQLITMQSSQDIRRQAIDNGVVLQLTAATSDLEPGDSLTVYARITDPRNYDITAADLTFTHSSNLTLNSIVKGDYFETPISEMNYPPNTDHANWDPSWDNIGTVLYNNTSQKRFALGALCDYCYLGEGETTPPLNSIPECGSTPPECYVKNTQGVIAVLTFNINGAGDAFINFDPQNTQIAALNHDDSVHDNALGNLEFTIAGSTSNCLADIVDNQGNLGADGYVNGADFDFLVNQFDAFTACSGNSCEADIVNNQGNPGSDNYVNGADFDYLVNQYDAFSQCVAN